MRLTVPCLALGLAFATAAAPISPVAWADSVQVDEADLVGLSELVVHGVVDRVEVRAWGPAAVPVTVITVRVSEVWKGTFTPSVEVWQAGGPTSDGRWMTTSGAVRYTPGAPVVLFLERSTTGVLVTAGSDLGALDASGAKLRGLPLVASPADEAGPGDGTPFRGLSAAAARARVRQLATASWPAHVPR